jgi:hypothetical protein
LTATDGPDGTNPLVEATGPENVVLDIIVSPYKVKLICRVCVCWGSHDKLVNPR